MLRTVRGQGQNEVIWEGIIYIGHGEDEVIDVSQTDLGIEHVVHETLIGEIEWETEPGFLELYNDFSQNLFKQNWSYTSIAITDMKMSPEMVRTVLDIVGTDSIGSALLKLYGSESLVPFQKYPEPLPALLKECVKEATE